MRYIYTTYIKFSITFIHIRYFIREKEEKRKNKQKRNHFFSDEERELQEVRKGTAGIEPAKSIKSNLAAIRKRSEKTRGQ